VSDNPEYLIFQHLLVPTGSRLKGFCCIYILWLPAFLDLSFSFLLCLLVRQSILSYLWKSRATDA